MSISVIGVVRKIIPSLLRAVISPVKSATYSDFENESNITSTGGSVR